MQETGAPPRFGVVIIGRNEGERLRLCLESVLPWTARIVYVDSGSTDDSVTLARRLGAQVVQLDLSLPFTAARARNEGLRRLRELVPGVDYVQFVDGDCEVRPTWLDAAARFLDVTPDVGVVWGHVRERYPESSIYNMLFDMGWDTAVGEVKACGGNVMMRINAFETVGGYRSDLIAGEEPELCVRLRAAGWRIWRLDEEMALHDVAMTRFSQWWKRAVRGGYALAQGAYLHGVGPERHCVRETLSIWLWGLVLPCGIVVAALGFGNAAWYLLAIYPLQVVRLALRSGGKPRAAWARAAFLVLGKFAEAFGQLKFMYYRMIGSKTRLIEYK